MPERDVAREVFPTDGAKTYGLMEVVEGTAPRKNSVAEKATRLFKCATWATVRFLHLCVPGQLVNDSGRTVLHLPESQARKSDWDRFRERIGEIEVTEKHRRRPAA